MRGGKMAQWVECKSPKPEGLIWILNTHENDWYTVRSGSRGQREANPGTFWPASLTCLVNSKPVRDPVSKTGLQVPKK